MNVNGLCGYVFALLLIQIRESIKTEKLCTVRILNYRLILPFIFISVVKALNLFTGYAESIYTTFNRKDKSSFWNLLHISPVRDATGKVILTSYFLVELSTSNVYDLFYVRHRSILVVEVSAFMVLNEVSCIP